ncbi:MAG: LysR family transcriptional regulator [Cucumibacter sp.]
MSAPLDLDQLRTFAAIADCGSFTEAARRVNKTQSAVSMQIKRLEERLGHGLFSRVRRKVELTAQGEALFTRARRMLQINADIIDMFTDVDLSGTIRFGMPDDYASKLLPKILSSFQKTNPRIQVEVTCQPSEDLLAGMKTGKFDIIVFTQGTLRETGELFRTEPMFWVSSPGWKAGEEDTLPLSIACGPTTCCWRAAAESALNRAGRDFRVAYVSSSATGIISAVSSNLAVGYLAESSIQPGMRILGPKDGFPRLPNAELALLRASNAYGGIYDALARHIVEKLGNLDTGTGAERKSVTAA